MADFFLIFHLFPFTSLFIEIHPPIGANATFVLCLNFCFSFKLWRKFKCFLWRVTKNRKVYSINLKRYNLLFVWWTKNYWISKYILLMEAGFFSSEIGIVCELDDERCNGVRNIWNLNILYLVNARRSNVISQGLVLFHTQTFRYSIIFNYQTNSVRIKNYLISFNYWFYNDAVKLIFYVLDNKIIRNFLTIFTYLIEII